MPQVRGFVPKTKSSSIAWKSAVKVRIDGETPSASMRATADWVVPARTASCFWLRR